MHYRNVIFRSVSILSAINAMSTSSQNSSLELNSNHTAPFEIIGGKLFNSQTGEDFFLKTLTDHPTMAPESWNPQILNSEVGFIDPLAEASSCLRDLKFFEKSNVDTIRIHSIDGGRGLDICMEALANKGIYILADISEQKKAIKRDRSGWDIPLFKRYEALISVVQKYPDILGFFEGNKVTNDDNNPGASFIEAAIGDIKRYIQGNEYRQIPIGYSLNDDIATREYLAEYFACNGERTADFSGTNMYERCGYSFCVNTGYREGTLETTNNSVFFSEFHYNAIGPRPSGEISTNFGSEMFKIRSGILWHMYFKENEYGSIKIDEFASVHELEDFKYLQNAYNNNMSHGTTRGKYLQDANFEITSQFARRQNEVSTQQARQSWKGSTKLPPTHNAEICHCLAQVLPWIATSFLSDRNFQDHLDYACSQVDCSDIAAEGAKGRCDEFSYCLSEPKLVLESRKFYNTEKNNLVGVCPMKGNNISFNRNSLNVTDLRCAEISQKSKLAKKKPKAFGIDSGSPTTKFKHSGYALLLVSFIFATIVF